MPAEDTGVAEAEPRPAMMERETALTKVQLCGCALSGQQPCLLPAHNQGVVKLPRSPVLVLIWNQNNLDDFWAASMANVFNKLHGKILMSHLVKLRLSRLGNVPAGIFPSAPTIFRSSLWSSFLWIEVSTTKGNRLSCMPCSLAFMTQS